MRHPSALRFASASPIALAVALGATAASCNLVLGLDAFIDCPEDPKCPALTTTGSGGATTTANTGGHGGVIPPPTCTDGEKNGAETDVDCGGSACDECADDKGCSNGGDCQSKVCMGGLCLKPTCSDLVQNADETDVDCGGSSCGPCPEGKGCVVGGDCAGGSCVGGKCAPTCTDQVKNGDESDVDCGGSTCAKCAIDGKCATGSDCETGVCQAQKCVTYYVWAKQFGDLNAQNALTLTSDSLGNAFLFSSVSGTTDFGGGPLTTTGTGAIAKFDTNGTHVWSKLIPGSVSSASHDAIGSVLLAGAAPNGADFGGGPLSGFGPQNTFVAKLGTGGNHIFSKMFPNLRKGLAETTKFTTGFVLTGGVSFSAIDFGCGSLSTGTNTGANIAVARFDFQNNCTWSQVFVSNSVEGNAAQAIAVDKDDNVVVAGVFTGTIDFGCGAVTSAAGVLGDFFVTKFDAAGGCVWTRTFTDPVHGGDGDHTISRIAVDTGGNIDLVGQFAGPLTFGTNALAALGTYDIFLAQLDPSGSVKWAKSFGIPGSYNSANALASSPDGRIVIGGNATPGTDFGGGPLPVGEAVIAEFDAAGNHLWSRDFLSVQGSGVAGLAFSGANHLLAAGTFYGQVDFGGPGALTTMGSYDIFLAKLLVP